MTRVGLISGDSAANADHSHLPRSITLAWDAQHFRWSFVLVPRAKRAVLNMRRWGLRRAVRSQILWTLGAFGSNDDPLLREVVLAQFRHVNLLPFLSAESRNITACNFRQFLFRYVARVPQRSPNFQSASLM